MPNQTEQPNLSQPRYLTALFLQSLGVLNIVFAPLGILLGLAMKAGRGEPIDAMWLTLMLAILMAGLTLGGLLLAAASLLRNCSSLAAVLAPDGPPPDPLDLASNYREGADGGVANRLVGATIDWAAGPATHWASCAAHGFDVESLPESEQPAARERIRTHRQRVAGEAIVDAINARRLGEARSMLEDARALFGALPTWDRLEERIDAASARNEPLDHAASRRLIRQAVERGRWAFAENCAHRLCRVHPQSSRCRKLWEDIRRTRLHAHIQQACTQHRWAEALAAAGEFFERFPESFEAQQLHSQMETLRHNAEVQTRREYEMRFQELLEGRYYAEALSVARTVIDQYPESLQAVELRRHLPLLQRYVSGAHNA